MLLTCLLYGLPIANPDESVAVEAVDPLNLAIGTGFNIFMIKSMLVSQGLLDLLSSIPALRVNLVSN